MTRWLREVPAASICVAARTNDLVKNRYKRLLEAAGVACAVVATDFDDARAPDAVRLSTMHRMKGLEFPRVLLAGVQHGTVPPTITLADAAAQADHELQERCLLYVASTRARDELVVTGFGGPSALLGPAARSRP